MSLKGMLPHTFEYDAPKDDPGCVELRIHFNFTPGTPETGRYSGPPENYDPGSGHEVEYLYAEREVVRADKYQNPRTVFERLKSDEWLDEYCQSWLASREAVDLLEGLPDGGEPDPDRQREDREERRQMEHE